MDDRQIRIFFQVILSMVIITIFSFLSPFIQYSRIQYIMFFIGLLMAAVLGYLAPIGIHLISEIFGKLIYGSLFSDDSYEYRFYQEEMDKAKNLTRVGEYDHAIQVYREIIRKSPMMYEPRFHLAQIYRKAGYFGLALNEYQRIMALKDQSGTTHPFVLESERAIGELERMLSEMKQESLNHS